MANVLFVCTSNKDRSPALEKYFYEVCPRHQYRSAGINKYFCEKNETHLIQLYDIEWADIIVFCEEIHVLNVTNVFDLNTEIGENFGHFTLLEKKKSFIVLDCGNYQEGCIGEDYLQKADQKLEKLLFA